jgi:hypothetical protein
MKKEAIAALAMLLISISASGQETFRAGAGVGAPELANATLRYQLKQVQVGVSYGWIKAKGDELTALTTNVSIHLWGSSPLSDKHVWFLRPGLTFFKDRSSDIIDSYTYGNLQIGRDLLISKRVGIELYGGLSVELDHSREDRAPDPEFDFNIDIDIPIFFSAGISIYVRL